MCYWVFFFLRKSGSLETKKSILYAGLESDDQRNGSQLILGHLLSFKSQKWYKKCFVFFFLNID